MNRRSVQPLLASYLQSKACRAGIPISGTFELTPLCNMDCKMCYVRMSRDQQERIQPLADGQSWLALAEEAAQAGMLYLLITGGEPFLHPQLPQIMAGLSKMGLVVTLNSNGTLIDEACIQWLKEAPPFRVNVTLYGASDETYRRLCGNPRGFTQATRGIRLLRQAGISVKLNCSITPDNKEDLPGIVAFARENGLMLQANSYMFPPVRRDKDKIGKNHRFSPEEAAYRMAVLEYLTKGADAFLQTDPNAAPALPVDTEEACGEEGRGISCTAGRSSFWITWEGKMLPCGMFPSDKADNVFSRGFGPLWDQIKAETAAIRLPAQCATCESRSVCRACAAMTVTETGRFDGVPEYRCRMAKAYPSQRQRLICQIAAGCHTLEFGED